MSLYLKHRPKSFDKVLGNEGVVDALQGIVEDVKDGVEDHPHSFLFHGPKGCGKTTLARILGLELGVKGNDLREMDSADFRGIDVVRNIRQQSHYRALEGDRRMWIMDEAHQLTSQAQSALLKILEDTPEHVYFALCTTDPQKLLGTVKDRCTQFEVGPLSKKNMKKLLVRTCKREKEKVQKKVLKSILKDSDGHPRAALQLLDKALRVPPEKRMKAVKKAIKEEQESIELCRALIKGKPWSKVRKILQGLENQDEESIRRHVLGYAKTVALNGKNHRAFMILEEFKEPFYDSGFPGLVHSSAVVTES